VKGTNVFVMREGRKESSLIDYTVEISDGMVVAVAVQWSLMETLKLLRLVLFGTIS
jgi:hypothetical protein